MDQKEEFSARNELKRINTKSIGQDASAFSYDIDVLEKEQIQSLRGNRFDLSRFKKLYSSSADNEEYLLKRPFDIGLSFAGILFSFPLWIIIAIAIWLEDKANPFFTSERIGKQGRPFKNFKFRTMTPNADKRFGSRQATENDHRITKVGKLLRKTALDELPQLLNILKGDMSFVGPRPLLPVEIEVRQESYEKPIPLNKIRGFSMRHSVTPGLTGIAQIFAPRDIIRRRKFQYDLLYIKRQNLIFDVKLILLSFWITFRGKWESRGKKF